MAFTCFFDSINQMQNMVRMTPLITPGFRLPPGKYGVNIVATTLRIGIIKKILTTVDIFSLGIKLVNNCVF